MPAKVRPRSRAAAPGITKKAATRRTPTTFTATTRARAR